MLRYLFFISIFYFILSPTSAQKFTEIKQKESHGKIIISMSPQIDSLINNIKPSTKQENRQNKKEDAQPKKNENTTKIKSDSSKIINHSEKTSKNRVFEQRIRNKAIGYRIQIYTGGNKRSDKEKAIVFQNKAQRLFPELSSYIHFISPHWVCRVGDFKTREAAQIYVSKMHSKNISYEIRIVKSEVLIIK